MTGMLLFDDGDIDVSAHLEIATQLSLVGIGLVVAFFLVRPELWRRMFFRRIDPRPAALMRIVYGLVVLWTFLDFVAAHPPLPYSTARYLFTDDGLWLTDLARKQYGGGLGMAYDPRYGFEHWWGAFQFLWGRGSILHLRSDPPFVFTLYTLMCTSLVLMIFGVRTRTTTVISWILVETMYRYSPVFYTGGDTVTRVFLFLGMFCRWGEAYSFDTWRRRRNAILEGAGSIPPLRKIAAWPQRLMMLQLAIIYCATGLLKSGNTWAHGTALYYSLSLDHFYRFQQTPLVAITHYLGILPLTTIVVRYWEMLFPLALVGVAVNAYERDRGHGTWPKVAYWRRFVGYVLFAGAWAVGSYIAGLGAYSYVPDRALPGLTPNARTVLFAGLAFAILPVCVGLYRGLRRLRDRAGPATTWLTRWRALRAKRSGRLGALLDAGRAAGPGAFDFIRHFVLGRRTWLVVGFGMHIGIDLGMNVGTFAEVMMAVYLAWLSGPEVEAFWRYALSRPLVPGEGTRPVRGARWRRALFGPFDRLLHRGHGKRYTIHHHPDDASVRRAALLRLWDLGHRLEFVADANVPPERLRLQVEGNTAVFAGDEAARWLVRVLPGLWLMRPFRRVAGFAVGPLARLILRQRR